MHTCKQVEIKIFRRNIWQIRQQGKTDWPVEKLISYTKYCAYQYPHQLYVDNKFVFEVTPKKGK